MDTVTVKINPNTVRGKHLIVLLHDMAKDGNDIVFEKIPNPVTRKAIQDIEAGKVTKVKNCHSFILLHTKHRFIPRIGIRQSYIYSDIGCP